MAFVFLSHRGLDKPRIRPFVCRMIERGVPIWIDRPEEFNLNLGPEDRPIERSHLGGAIGLGKDWPVQIDQALMQACAVVVFWSSNWTSDREVLVREHGAAHVFHNAGYSSYLPVMLDEPSQLDEQVIKYRQAVNDNVQAFNVARFGQEHWDALADALEELWRRAESRADRLHATASSGAPAVDWHKELSAPHNSARIVELLLRLAPGPAVSPHLIPIDVKRAFADSIVEVEASLLVSEAGGTVLQTFAAEMRRRPHVLVVMPASVPSPLRVPSLEYWQSVFANACVLGPRMVAALLLCVRRAAISGKEDEIATLLRQLESDQ